MPRRLVLLLLLASGCADDPPVDVRTRLATVGKAYDIEILAADPTFPVRVTHGVIDGKPARVAALERYVPLFAEEFVLYPRSLVKRARLRRIVLCEGISFAGGLRGAIPDWENDTLYVDVQRGAWDRTYLCKVLHHEIFHMIDYRDDGCVYDDAAWVALNPKGFKYGAGGASAQESAQTSLLTNRYPGFLNHYSTTGVEEDKAEMFANMVVDPAYVEGRAKNDPVVEAKAKRMRELLAAFCPEMDARFWEGVRRVKRRRRIAARPLKCSAGAGSDGPHADYLEHFRKDGAQVVVDR
jgi:hypothetical protein